MADNQATGAAPAPAPTPAPAAPAAGSGIDPKLGGLLCYLPVGPIPLLADIFFLVAEPYKNDKFLRFHAFQSLFTGVAFMVLWFAVFIVGIVMTAVFAPLALLLIPAYLLLGLGGLVLMIVCMMKAYGGQMWRIPIVGNFAAKQAGI